MSTEADSHDDASRSELTIEQRERAARRAWRVSGLLVPLLFAVVFFGGLCASFYLHYHSSDPDGTNQQTPVADDKTPIEGEPDDTSLIDKLKNTFASSKPDPPSETEQLRTHHEFRRVSFALEVAQAELAIGHLEVATAEWQRLVDATLQDDAGRRVAGDSAQLARFVVLQNLERPVGAVDVLKAELNSHVKQFQNSNDAVDLDRLTTLVLHTKQQALFSFAIYQTHHNALENLRSDVIATPPAESNLAVILKQRQQALTMERNKLSEQASKTAGIEIDAQLAALKESRSEQAVLVAELQTRLELVETGAAGTASAEASTPLPTEGYRRDFAAIGASLRPFITPGYMQPNSADDVVYGKSKLPVSYSALQRIGALADSEQGLKTLFRVGGSKSANQKNDRPLGDFPKMNAMSDFENPEVAARLREAQRMLRDYGLLMVEDGLLSP